MSSSMGNNNNFSFATEIHFFVASILSDTALYALLFSSKKKPAAGDNSASRRKIYSSWEKAVQNQPDKEYQQQQTV